MRRKFGLGKRGRFDALAVFAALALGTLDRMARVVETQAFPAYPSFWARDGPAWIGHALPKGTALPRWAGDGCAAVAFGRINDALAIDATFGGAAGDRGAGGDARPVAAEFTGGAGDLRARIGFTDPVEAAFSGRTAVSIAVVFDADAADAELIDGAGRKEASIDATARCTAGSLGASFLGARVAVADIALAGHPGRTFVETAKDLALTFVAAHPDRTQDAVVDLAGAVVVLAVADLDGGLHRIASRPCSIDARLFAIAAGGRASQGQTFVHRSVAVVIDPVADLGLLDGLGCATFRAAVFWTVLASFSGLAEAVAAGGSAGGAILGAGRAGFGGFAEAIATGRRAAATVFGAVFTRFVRFASAIAADRPALRAIRRAVDAVLVF